MRILVGYLCFSAVALYAILPTNRCGFPIVAAGAVGQSQLLLLPERSHRYLTYFAMEFPGKTRGFSAADYMASHTTLKGALEVQFDQPFVSALAGGEIYLVNTGGAPALGKIMKINNTSSLLWEAQDRERVMKFPPKHPNDPHLFLASLREAGLEGLISDSVEVVTDGSHLITSTPPHIRHRIVSHRNWLVRAQRESGIPELLEWFRDLIWIDWYVRIEGGQSGVQRLSAASRRYLEGNLLSAEEETALSSDLDSLLSQVNRASQVLEIFPLTGAPE